VTASEHPPLGWYSATLDRKQPAITAVLEMRAATAGVAALVSIDFDLQVQISSP
jgi:hypothetical protein